MRPKAKIPSPPMPAIARESKPLATSGTSTGTARRSGLEWVMGTVTLYTQAAEFAPGVNPLGIAASNGGTVLIGNF